MGRASVIIIITFAGLMALGSLIDYIFLGGAIAPREAEKYPALAGLGILFIALLLFLARPASKGPTVVRLG